MRPQLFSCYFDGKDGSTQWPRLARVLAYTAAGHCANWERSIVAISPDRVDRVHRSATRSHVHNTQKLDVWAARVRDAADGQALLLIDADTVILRPLDDVWDRPFDLAYTVRAGCRFPFNCGVMFLRASDVTRRLMDAWADENRRQIADEGRHKNWTRRFGGINQAAFGALLATDASADVQLLELPCAEWNCEDHSWPSFNPALTRILHVKSALRRAVFGMSGEQALRDLRRLWRDLEREAVHEGEMAHAGIADGS